MTTAALVAALALLNLNTATPGELDALPGIGPVLAGRIVEFREKRGGFRRVEELLAIEGISERMWQELRLRVEVRPEPAPEPARQNQSAMTRPRPRTASLRKNPPGEWIGQKVLGAVPAMNA